jgi:hypothetical protein
MHFNTLQPLLQSPSTHASLVYTPLPRPIVNTHLQPLHPFQRRTARLAGECVLIQPVHDDLTRFRRAQGLAGTRGCTRPGHLTPSTVMVPGAEFDDACNVEQGKETHQDALPL